MDQQIPGLLPSVGAGDTVTATITPSQNLRAGINTYCLAGTDSLGVPEPPALAGSV
jgi:hypothetical protein